MNNSEKKLEMIEILIREFTETFENRPNMLGNPEEVNAIFFYMDKIEFILKKGHQLKYWEHSWPTFLIEKRLIIGARDMLKEKLKENGDDFSLLQHLRTEYRNKCKAYDTDNSDP